MNDAHNVREYSVTNGEAKPEEDSWPNLLTKRRGPGCGATVDNLIVAGGVSDWDDVLSSVEVYHIATKALRRGGSLQQARAYFQMIPVGSTHPRLLAVGGQNGTSTSDTSEWWEEEEDSWEEGPALSRGRSNFAALMAPPRLVCSEIDPPAHSCPAAQNTGQTCLFPTGEPGEGAQVCEIEGNDFSCPTADASTNATCDTERCPLQGPPMAPIMELQLTGQVVVG